MPHDINTTLDTKPPVATRAIASRDFVSARGRLRSAIFDAVLDDTARAHELANWMVIIADLRSRLPPSQIAEILIDAAAFYRTFAKSPTSR